MVKRFKKKCGSATECEIFAIFQAMVIIESNTMKDEQVKKIYLRTDSSDAKLFFIQKNKIKIFNKNLKLCDEIKTTHERINRKMKEKNIDFELKHISRKQNRTAHKYSYKAFKNCKDKDPISNMMQKKKELAQLYNKIGLKMAKVLMYLFLISNEEKIVLKTQKEIANALNLSSTNINRIFYKLRELKILEKKANGRYFLVI